MLFPIHIMILGGIFFFFWFGIKRLGIKCFALVLSLILFLLVCFIFVELSSETKDAYEIAKNIGYSPLGEDMSLWWPFQGIHRFISQKLYVGMSRDEVHGVMKGYYKMDSGRRSGDGYFERYYFKLGLLRRPCIEILYTKDFRVTMYDWL